MRISGLSGCRGLLASTVIGLGLAFSASANATPLPAVFTVSGVFDDGGTLSGQFGINLYGYIDDGVVNITATAGTTLTSTQVYTIPPDDRSIIPNDPLTATGLTFFNVTIAPYRELHLEFGTPINESVLPNSPQNTFLPLALIANQSYECYSWSCPGPTGLGGNTRYLVSGAVGANGVDNTPLPGALPLFASGAGMLGLLGWRRRRKAAATV